MEKAVAVCSGGIDSSANGLMLLKEGYEVHFLHVSHGQKSAEGESGAVHRIVNWLKAEGYSVEEKQYKIDIYKQMPSSALTDKSKPVPNGLEGVYGSTIGELFTPARNVVLLAIASAYAESIGAEVITLGCNQSEVAYGDNTKEFLDRYTKVLELGCYKCHPQVISPEWEMSKVDIYRWVGENFPEILKFGWSCDDSPGKKGLMCGHCGCDRNRQLTLLILKQMFPGSKQVYEDVEYEDGNWFEEVFLPTIRERGTPRNKWFSQYAKELGCKVI